MSLHSAKMPSLKDKLLEEEKNLQAELEAVEKAKVRAGKEEKKESPKVKEVPKDKKHNK